MSQAIVSDTNFSSASSVSPTAGAVVAKPRRVHRKPSIIAGKYSGKGTDAEKSLTSRNYDSVRGSCASLSASSSASTIASRKLSRGSFSGAHSITISTDPLSDGSTCSMLGTLQREILLLAYTHGCLEFGSFPTKGGKETPFALKADFLHNGEACDLLAKAYAYKLVQSGTSFDVLFGAAHKGTPLVACTSMVLAREYAMPAPFVYDRKDPLEPAEGGGQLIGAIEACRRKSVGCVTDGSGVVSGSLRRRTSSSSAAAGDSQSNPDKAGDSQSSSATAGDLQSTSALSTRPARVVLLSDELPAVESARAILASLHIHFPDAQVAAVCILLDTQERDEKDEKVTEAQQFEVQYATKVLALLTTTDILHFLNELVASGDNLEARSSLQKVRNSLLEYQRAYTVTDELLSDVL